MREIKAWVYIATSILGILFAIPFFIVGFFYRFAVGGFKKGFEYAEEDFDTENLKC